MAEQRLYLAVPYEERGLARAAGARWDATARAWYAGPKADLTTLSRWRAESITSAPNPRDEFILAMREEGLLVVGPHPIPDGKPHRVAVEGDREDAKGRYPRPSGRYVLHLDGLPAGYLKNFRRGTYQGWKSRGTRLPPEQMAALRATIVRREQERAEERARAVEAAAARVQAKISTLQPAITPTAYMAQKGLAPTIGAMTDRGRMTTYLPAIDADGKQWTMQTIRRDGFKLVEEDSRKEGTCHIVGGDLETLEGVAMLLMSEGYATAATVSDAASLPALAAFDAGNLLPVAQALRSRFPGKPILIAGDDDRGIEARDGHNPGRDKANAAADAVEGLAIFPQFAAGEVERDPKRFTDFNDLANESALGRDAVRTQVRAGMATLARRQWPAEDDATIREVGMAHPGDGGIKQSGDEPLPTEERARRLEEAIDRCRNVISTGGGLADASRDSPIGDGGGAASNQPGDVPPEIAKRYLTETSRLSGNKAFYESTTSPEPAFVDRGTLLASPSDSPAVIADMIEIARHRNWSTIEVEGTEAFRREAWSRAKEAGLEVRGFRPGERDRQDLARRSKAGRQVEESSMTRAVDLKGSSGEAGPPRTYLSVPFADKEAAKAAGAQWDREARSWYIDGSERAEIARWLPSEAQERAEQIISRDTSARAQLRSIETVVGATLADDPDAQRRVLQAGRDTLADMVSRGKAVAPPQLRSEGVTHEADVSSLPPTEPTPPARRTPERTRGR